MIKILFVCHGNICRSTMAEFVMADMAKKAGFEVMVDSAATSREEIGNGVHHGTLRKLREVGVPVYPHYAKQLTKADYKNFDYIIGMDSMNMRNITRIVGEDRDNKVYMLLDFTKRKGQSIADPWYTGNFDVTYDDIKEGCEGLLAYLQANKKG